MVKFLFFDNRDYELVQGFDRVLERPRKYDGNPIVKPDMPWEHAIVLYGSALKVEGRPFQLWYSAAELPGKTRLAYAESEDGISWRKPEMDVFLHNGCRTNVVFTGNPHGAAVIYDETDRREDWKYKMVCGAGQVGHIHAYHSADGIHWEPVRSEPVIPVGPDCPMSLLRRPDGIYAAHHRVDKGARSNPADRRIGRSESADFVDWHGGRVVLEPGPGDPPQFEMYGMGVAMYGDYEIGTLWAYHTDLEDTSTGKAVGNQEAELTYSRSGWAWHRAMQGQAFIPRGDIGSWDSGNLQCATAPVFLKDEIRYYFAGTDLRHARRWEEAGTGRFGVGTAALKPDRFIALAAGERTATAYTRCFTLSSPEVYVNAHVHKDGQIRLEVLDQVCRPIEGFEMRMCLPIGGDSLSHAVRWEGQPDLSRIVDRPIRWRLNATRARVYSVWMPDGESGSCYHRFHSILRSHPYLLT